MFRIIGLSLLVLGLSSAALVYWLGTRATDNSDDLSLTNFDHSTQRQMGILYGKQGELLEEWMNDLKQPGTQAILIVISSSVGAAICFKFARLWERADAA